MAISPGIHFIGRTLAHVFLSCLVTWAILFSISDRLGSISKSSLFLLSITLYLLGVFVAKPLVDDHRNSRMAKALGATLPPRVDRGVLKKSIENFETGYPGEFGGFLIWRKLKLVLEVENFNEWTGKYGPTFRYTIGTEERVCHIHLRAFLSAYHFCASILQQNLTL